LGNCQDSSSVIVEVNPKPVINIISGNTTVCPGSTVTVSFEVDPNGATSVDWNFDSPAFDTSGTVTTATTITFDMVVNSTTTGTITAESSDGCEAEPKMITITVQNLPTPILTPSSTVICPGDDLVLTTTLFSGNQVTYEWFKDGVSLGTTTLPTFTVTPPMTGNYTVEVTVDGCSATSAGVQVSASEAPVAVDDEYTSDVIAPVEGTVTDNDDIPSASTVAVVTNVPTGSGELVLNNDGTFTFTPSAGVQSPVTFTYSVCLVDCPDECDEATVTIVFNVECIVPNVITPNGDGVNDFVDIKCVPPSNSTTPNNTRLRIFNRWGDEIASYEPYFSEVGKGWDGTYGDSKKPVPAATYFYLFEFDKTSGDKPQAGYIKVAR
jgi:gliding motility-associated-like protein